jgi:hypothetical protein
MIAPTVSSAQPITLGRSEPPAYAPGCDEDRDLHARLERFLDDALQHQAEEDCEAKCAAPGCLV